MNKLTLGSLFDGSGGFPLAGLLAGITPVWASEIEPFPIRATTKRLPFMKHYGDVSKIRGSEIEPVDIITFGSPCQDMSVAGKRAGLDGSRSNLFYEAIRIIKEMRCATNGTKPRYIVWENVPGALSSNNGHDFRSVLEAICSVKDTDPIIPESPKGKWKYAGSIVGDNYSVAWRILDAQFWGVPQRRRRIFLVADFAGGSAEQILFKSESLSGYSAKGFCSWQGTARGFETGTDAASFDGYNVALENHPTDSRVKLSEDGMAQTLTSRMGTGENNVPLLMEIRSGCEGGGKEPLIQEDKSATLGCNNDQALFVPKVYGICSKDSNAMKSDNPKSGFYEAETSRCLDANGGNPACNQGGMAVVVLQGSMIGRADKNGPQGSGVNEGVSFTLDAADRHAVAYCMTTGTYTQALEEQSPTLTARDYKDPPVVNETEPEYIVRRLTPTECTRLQGFPDWWCARLETDEPTEEEIEFWTEVFEIHRSVMGTSSKPKSRNQIVKWLKNPHSDSAEYKMWGNGVALPCVYFVLYSLKYNFKFRDKQKSVLEGGGEKC